jgi:hypothetical protein
MEPTWVRAVYLHLMALIGVVVIAFGVLGFALGVVHTAAPDLKSGDPFTSIATSIVDIAGTVANSANNDGNNVPPSVTKGIASAKHELNRQSRDHSIDGMLHGLFMALIGFGIYSYHMRKTQAGQPRSAIRIPAAAPPMPPQGGVPNPTTGWPPPQGPPGAPL